MLKVFLSPMLFVLLLPLGSDSFPGPPPRPIGPMDRPALGESDMSFPPRPRPPWNPPPTFPWMEEMAQRRPRPPWNPPPTLPGMELYPPRPRPPWNPPPTFPSLDSQYNYPPRPR